MTFPCSCSWNTTADGLVTQDRVCGRRPSGVPPLQSSYHQRPQSFYPPLTPPLAGDAIFPSDLLILNGACKRRPTVAGVIYHGMNYTPPMFSAFVSLHCRDKKPAAFSLSRSDLSSPPRAGRYTPHLKHMHILARDPTVCLPNARFLAS